MALIPFIVVWEILAIWLLVEMNDRDEDGEDDDAACCCNCC